MPHYARNALTWLALLVCLAVAIVWRASHLGEAAFDGDELYAVRIQGLSLKTLALVVARDSLHTNHPPLMNVPFVFWVGLLGDDEATVRALPVACSVATVLVTFWLAHGLGGLRMAVVAALTVALNPLHIAYAQEARHYALLSLLVTAAHALFLSGVLRPRRWTLPLYFIVCLTAFMTHYFAVPALAAHGALALWLLTSADEATRRRASELLLALLTSMLPLVAWAPIVRWQSAQPWDHLQALSWESFSNCLRDVGGWGTDRHWLIAAGVTLALMVLGWAYYRGPLSPQPIKGSEDSAPRAPLGRIVGWLLLGGGIVAALVAALLVPRYVLPRAEVVLQQYDYDAATIARELRLVHYLTVAMPLSLAAMGLAQVLWRKLIGAIEQGGARLAWKGAALSPALYVGTLLLAPLAVIGLMSLLNIPFLQPRNLIILITPLALAIGLGSAVLCERAALSPLAGVLLILLAAGWLHYDPVSRPLGFAGRRLGMHTPPWKRLEAALATLPAAGALATVATPDTDPILFYSAARQPQRLQTAQQLAELLARAGKVYFVTLPRDERSEQVAQPLAAGARILWSDDETNPQLALVELTSGP